MHQSPEYIDGAGLWGGRLISFDSLPSTNRWLLDNPADCGHGDVVLALNQTLGRGRFQRRWLSVAGRSLTLSAALRQTRPEEPVDPSVCQAAAVAVRAVLSKHGLGAALKWPNDVLIEGRKVAGILAESDPEALVTALGIGININIAADDFDGHHIMQPATSMAMETGIQFDTQTIRADLISALEIALARAKTDLPGLLEEWKRHDFLSGSRIEVNTTTGPVGGTYLGLNAAGHLLLEDDAGATRTFLSGDVSLSAGQ